MDCKSIKLQAHRGVSTDFPENTMAAFIGAVEQGYDIIELDPAVTKDKKFVIMHDRTLNRTGRTADGGLLPEEKKVADATYGEISTYEFGSWFDKAFTGERAPLLEEVLALSEQTGIVLKLDNKFERFEADDMEAFLSLLERSQANLAFTCSRADNLIMLAKRFPKAQLHYDGRIDEETLEHLRQAVGSDRLTVWVPFANRHTTWVKVEFLDSAMAARIKKYADLGVWILSTEEEFEKAKELGADVVETTGSIKPKKEYDI
jgi:glycerophosphoryl diester phosphodiesterase